MSHPDDAKEVDALVLALMNARTFLQMLADGEQVGRCPGVLCALKDANEVLEKYDDCGRFGLVLVEEQ